MTAVSGPARAWLDQLDLDVDRRLAAVVARRWMADGYNSEINANALVLELTAEVKDLLSAEHAALLAAARERDALRTAVERLAEEWRYKGEYGWGPWQAGEGPDIEGQVLDDAALRLRAVVADTTGEA